MRLDEITGDEKFDKMMSGIVKNAKPEYMEGNQNIQDWLKKYNDTDFILDQLTNNEGPKYSTYGANLKFNGDALVYKDQVLLSDALSNPNYRLKDLAKAYRNYNIKLQRAELERKKEERKKSIASIGEQLTDNTPLAAWYDLFTDKLAIPDYIKKSLNLPDDAPLYIDDADLVYGRDTVLRHAIYNKKWTMKDAIVNLRKYLLGKTNESIDPKIVSWLKRLK